MQSIIKDINRLSPKKDISLNDDLMHESEKNSEQVQNTEEQQMPIIRNMQPNQVVSDILASSHVPPVDLATQNSDKMTKVSSTKLLRRSSSWAQILHDDPADFIKPTDQKFSKGDPSAINITFSNITFKVQVPDIEAQKRKPLLKKWFGKTTMKSRTILDNISGMVRPGQLTAIMGTSGAGKTTLLNILSCRIDKNQKGITLTGSVKANGNDYDFDKFNQFAAFVMQHDILVDTLTPKEILRFVAKLRLEGSNKFKQERVDQLIKDLEIEKAQNTFIGNAQAKGISGGERKRTSIAIELIHNPPVLFLDEPTSGLDSFTAYKVIYKLKEFAEQGRTVIFTIHQPNSDIFRMFDHLILMARGKIAYQGSAQYVFNSQSKRLIPKALNYFGGFEKYLDMKNPEDISNPADRVIELLDEDQRDEKFEEIFDHYKNELVPVIDNFIEKIPVCGVKEHKTQNSFWYEFKIIFARTAKIFKRTPDLFALRLVMTFFISFIMCSVFFQLKDDPNENRNYYDRNGALFYFIDAFINFNLMLVIQTFPGERAIFLREYSSNTYKLGPYFLGRTLIEIPIMMLTSLVQVAITYYIIGLNDFSAAKFFIFYVISLLSALAGNAIGLMIGSIFSDAESADKQSTIFLLLIQLLCGFYVNRDTIPVWLRWIEWISPYKYALEAAFRNEYTDSPLGDLSIRQFDMDLGLELSIVLLLVTGLAYRLFAFIGLKLTLRTIQ